MPFFRAGQPNSIQLALLFLEKSLPWPWPLSFLLLHAHLKDVVVAMILVSSLTAKPGQVPSPGCHHQNAGHPVHSM